MVNNDVLDCYRLAREYHQNPNVFLEMPMSEVRIHMERTIELALIREREQQLRDEDDGYG